MQVRDCPARHHVGVACRPTTNPSDVVNPSMGKDEFYRDILEGLGVYYESTLIVDIAKTVDAGMSRREPAAGVDLYTVSSTPTP